MSFYIVVFHLSSKTLDPGFLFQFVLLFLSPILTLFLSSSSPLFLPFYPCLSQSVFLSLSLSIYFWRVRYTAITKSYHLWLTWGFVISQSPCMFANRWTYCLRSECIFVITVATHTQQWDPYVACFFYLLSDKSGIWQGHIQTCVCSYLFIFARVYSYRVTFSFVFVKA